MKKNNLFFLSVLFISAIATYIFIFPVILNLNSYVSGFYSTDEPYGVIWSFWWLKIAALNHNPVGSINIISCPFGINTNIIPFFPLWIILAKYFSIFFNEISAYNIILLLTFCLSVITMYYLVFFLTHEFGPSIFAALIYAFCPFHFVRTWQHFGTAQIQWLPLYFLILFKLWQKKTVKYGLLLGFIFALNYYFDTHFGYFLAVITPPLILYILFMINTKREKLEFLKSLFFSGVVAVILITPAFLPFLKDISQASRQMPSAYSFVRPFEDLFAQSARPLSYFLPFTEQPFFGKFTSIFVGTNFWGRSLTEHNIFLGYMPLFFCIIAVLKQKNLVVLMKNKGIDIRCLFQCCFLIAIFGWLCSQPPWWNIFGFKIYMPSFLLYKIFPMFRAYVRFGIVVMLGVSILASFGLIIVLNRFKSIKIKTIIIFFACFFSLFEFWSNPKEHIIDLSKYPKVYDWLKNQPGDFVIAEYPLDIIGPGEMYKFYQTKHHKKIINGTIPGTYAHEFSKNLIELSSERTPSILKWMGVRFVLVHTNDYKNSEIFTQTEEIAKIEKAKGLKRVFSLEGIEVYEVIAQPLKPENS